MSASASTEGVDMLIVHGCVITMDGQNRVLTDGAVAVKGDRIVAVDDAVNVTRNYRASKVLDARGRVVLPGFVDTYAHSGLGLLKGIFHQERGWNSNGVLFHATTPSWWYAEALLSNLERLRFGVTTGVFIVGSTPSRCDDAIFAEQTARGSMALGTRTMIGVGPPDPIIEHIPVPYTATWWEGGRAETRTFTYEQSLEQAESFISRYEGTEDGRIRTCLAYPYLFGRQTRRRWAFKYADEHIAVLAQRSSEVRRLADTYRVPIHTHVFRGAIEFGHDRLGPSVFDELCRPDVILSHANSLTPRDVELVARRDAKISAVPSMHENYLYGPCPLLELIEAGVTCSISTDGAAPNVGLDVLREVYKAMIYQRLRARTVAALPPGKLLRLITIEAAQVLGWGDQIGSLEVGKKADIITIDLRRAHLMPRVDPVQMVVYYATGRDVDNVIIDGRMLMHEGVISHVDEREILERAEQEAIQAFARMDLAPYLDRGNGYWRDATWPRLAADVVKKLPQWMEEDLTLTSDL